MAHQEDSALHLFIVLTRTYKTVAQKAKEDMERLGLNPSEFAVLELLYHKGHQPIQKIGEKVLLASGTMTYVIDKLEKKGYLKRMPCPNDRRVIHATITESGSALMKEKFPDHQAALHQIFDIIPDEKKDEVARILKDISFNAEKLDFKQSK